MYVCILSSVGMFCMYVCTYVYPYICMYACMYDCVYVSSYNDSIMCALQSLKVDNTRLRDSERKLLKETVVLKRTCKVEMTYMLLIPCVW